MNFLRENSNRAKLIVLFLWLTIVSEVLSIISSYFQFSVIEDFFNDYDIKDTDFEFADNLSNVITIVYFIVFLCSIIFFIQWFRRAYFNLHILLKDLKFDEGWAAGSWFVPFLNLFRPVEIMKELYERTSFILTENNVRFDNKKNVINIWWGFWIVSGVISNFIFRYSLNASTLESLQNLTIMNMISSVVSIVLGFFAIKVVKDYIYLEEKLHKINFTSKE